MDAQPQHAATSVPDCLIRLTENKYLDFQSQLDNALNSEGPIGLELTTTGGDADLARRICMDINLFGERLGREFWFTGKTTVYSAGVTILAGFPRERRFITKDCVLLIHERPMDMSLQLSGPLATAWLSDRSRARPRQLWGVSMRAVLPCARWSARSYPATVSEKCIQTWTVSFATLRGKSPRLVDLKFLNSCLSTFPGVASALPSPRTGRRLRAFRAQAGIKGKELLRASDTTQREPAD
jgi:hypothetical protein